MFILMRPFVCFSLAVMLAATLAPVSPCGAESKAATSERTFSKAGAAETVSVMYVTPRNRTASYQTEALFGGGRGTLRGGVSQVTFTPIPGLRDVVKSAPIHIPDETFKLTTVQEMTVAETLDALSDQVRADQTRVVMYTHGYNIGFKKSCHRAAIFQRALNLHGRLLLFSWPAEGNLLKYTWDEADLVWSVPHLTRVLEAIVQLVGAGNLDFVAHSLGARGAVQALARIACQQPDAPLINELVLVAPDIDRDVFAQELPALRPLVRRLTIYVSKNDKPLKLSEEVHGYPRLGDADDMLSVFEGVDTVDISHLDQRRLSGHLYHLYNPPVIDDLSWLLTGRPAAERSGLQRAVQNGQVFWQMQP